MKYLRWDRIHLRAEEITEEQAFDMIKTLEDCDTITFTRDDDYDGTERIIIDTY